jgi:hypothetical protein
MNELVRRRRLDPLENFVRRFIAVDRIWIRSEIDEARHLGLNLRASSGRDRGRGAGEQMGGVERALPDVFERRLRVSEDALPEERSEAVRDGAGGQGRRPVRLRQRP